MLNKIIIKGARQHNLKNISLDIPKNKLIVFTGVSGSGKSSLAFDTIYAEGQRRYVESLTSYARQFLGIMPKPDVDLIEGLQPSISIDQKSSSHNPRSTVGTITEIYDYLRLFFARIGSPHCPNCTRLIKRQSAAQIVISVLDLVKDALARNTQPFRILILSPIIRDRKGEFKELLDNLKAKGYSQIRADSRFFSLDDELTLIKTNKHSIDVVIDRFSLERKIFKSEIDLKAIKTRLSTSIEQALRLSEGLAVISHIKDASFNIPEKPKIFQDHLFSEKFSCPVCNISLAEIEPRLFSFNSPHGACVNCGGIGRLLKVDPDLILNPNLTIMEGGIRPYSRIILADTWFGRLILSVCKFLGIAATVPIKNIPNPLLNQLLYGTGENIHKATGENRHGRIVTIEEKFSGIIPDLEKRYRETDSEYVRSEISRYLRHEICSVCLGKRLKKESLSITISGKSIVDVSSLSVDGILNWIEQEKSKLSSRDTQIAHLLIKELINRLSFLKSVGLNYLTLNRSANSLSGGEAQRIRLASQIGSGLSGVLYVLDEPSIGLHQKDNIKLINSLKNLRDLGNTVIVVEHDREMMYQADLIYDFGPKAGSHGGKIIAVGTPEAIKKDRNSITGQYLSGKKTISMIDNQSNFNTENGKFIQVLKCTENNLKNIDLNIPLGKFVCVTGVSGSGKSSLIVDTLYQILASHFNPYSREKVGKYESVHGLQYIKRVVLIDQSPIGRTPRSNPATYSGAFNFIRDLYSQLAMSKARGYKAGRFSFNVKGGRCEACQGEGQTKIEMQFLPDVYVTCDVCMGLRFSSETLEVKFKDKSISDVLEMTVEESLKLFSNIPGLIVKLETLHQVGLSYIKLGQPAPQLSGGEAQRVKLASELSKRGSKDSIFILDEPTTGLHFADLEKLLSVLKQLVQIGNTVVVIEHNLDVIKNSDWIIDLGPEGGDNGGYIIAAGNPADIAKNKNSHTGAYIR